jgi:hypothetical protein
MMRKPTKKTFNFFEKITVTGGAFADNRLSWDFISCGILLLNEGATGNVVEYSFDGITTHGDLDPDKASAGLSFDGRHHSAIYFRLVSGTAALIRVEAWA